jgi:hypothetical protein
LSEGQMGGTINAAREALRNIHYIEYPIQRGATLPPPPTNLLDNNNGKSKEKFVEDLKRLAPLGWQLWTMLLSNQQEWWEKLQEPATIQVSRMAGSTFVFPWALVYDIPLAAYGQYTPCPLLENWDKVNALLNTSERRCPYESQHGRANTLCPFGFWGIKHVIEQPPSMPKDRDLPLIIQVAHDPPQMVAGLSLALDKDLTAKHLQSLELEHFQVLEFSTLEKIVTALKDPVEVVYFYCHGGRAPLPGTQQNTPFLEVGKNERFGPSDITFWRRTAWPEKHWKDISPLVFLNGCHTAELTPELLINFVDGFATAYAAGVIGTEITVLQSLASEAALQFFTHFQRNGMNVGQSVREMRLHFLMKGNLLGLAYTPYCSADLQF